MKAVRNFFIFIAILVLIAGIIAAVGYVCVKEYIFSHRDTFRFAGADFTEHTERLDNPYTGYYDIYGYKIREAEFIDDRVAKDISETAPDGRLVLLEIDIEAYADSKIYDHGLSQIDRLITMWTDTGRDVMVRFVYDFAGKAAETEPKDIEIIKLHMSQCANILNAHAGDVYLTQGIFVGDIGEMHGSDHMTTAGMRELGQYYASVLDPRIFLSVRTPEQYRIICERDVPLSYEESYSDDIGSRFGLFNDGMLASDIDLGTYGDSHLTPTAEHEGKGDRAEEIAFQNELCRYVPSGGEVVADNPLNDLMNAVRDLNDMHVSFLGRYHDEAVKEKWKNSLYDSTERGDYHFEGMNGYDYIERHLGYRYVARQSYQESRDIAGEDIKAKFEIENVGFSNAYHRFDVEMKLKGEDGLVVDLPYTDMSYDNRFWDSGKVTLVNLDIPFGQLPQQDYELWMRVTDPETGEVISFANNEFDSHYGLLIGFISPDKLSEEEAKQIFMDDVKTEGVFVMAKKVIKEYVDKR